ncbi:tryptophan 2,3-dioxygenase [Sphingomonas sp. Leaf17]|uniref:tryptophan 2,3-dioxygenase n=1 Tax=Sphingomonas sp. Leaf17 TaxID=1735683 RepID=UPI0006F65676|nr:tryptophan 2,3-dioxygenase family protein [Sphingomonas sp. Leaf17]KQM67651.1 tryptophan 2,3-dioxygenase [Sphingomonas sp. Leaf17]
MGGPTYRSYLRLPELLDVQSPVSGTHDELLFITIHQASELWLKLCLHELCEARRRIAADDLSPALKMMARVSRIQAQMIQSWEVLATMTPAEYGTMRGSLGGSSGFQSDQYRMLEFVLGNRSPAMAAMFDDEPAVADALRAELARPSLYDEALRLLARRGLPVPPARLDRDLSIAVPADRAVEACWATVYGDPDAYWDLYALAEKLVDLEYHVQLWRFGHLKTVERVIGFKTGTGGTAGAAYLARVLEQRFFPELLNVRTSL